MSATGPWKRSPSRPGRRHGFLAEGLHTVPGYRLTVPGMELRQVQPSGDQGWAPPACTLPAAERPLRLAEFDALFA